MKMRAFLLCLISVLASRVLWAQCQSVPLLSCASYSGGGNGGANPAGEGSELQFRVSGTEFGAVTSSSVSGADVVLGGTLSGITQLTCDNVRLDGNAISSTNANGDITLDPNGTGQVLFPMSSASRGIVLGAESASGIRLRWRDDGGTTRLEIHDGAGGNSAGLMVPLVFTVGDADAAVYVQPSSGGRFDLSSAIHLRWSDSSSAKDGTKDVGEKRISARVLADTDGGSALGWRQWAGECYVASDQTNATTTLASSTCSITVITGRKYGFKCILMQSDSVAAEGAAIDFSGGTAGETYFRAQATAFDTALNLSTQVDDLTDLISAGTFTGNGTFEVHGAFEPSSSGTFIPRFAQASHVTGTLTLFRGSHCFMWDMP